MSEIARDADALCGVRRAPLPAPGLASADQGLMREMMVDVRVGGNRSVPVMIEKCAV